MRLLTSKKITFLAVSLSLYTSLVVADETVSECERLYDVEDYDAAYEICKTAAEQGHAISQLNLAFMYYFGNGVIQNRTESARWFRSSAEQGHARAQFFLGAMYANGEGVIQNYTEAVKWYRAAAEQGSASAQWLLGYMYNWGNGVIQDFTLAHMWFNISASFGLDSAASARNIIASEMTSEQIAEAQALARQCINSNYTDCGY